MLRQALVAQRTAIEDGCGAPCWQPRPSEPKSKISNYGSEPDHVPKLEHKATLDSLESATGVSSPGASHAKDAARTSAIKEKVMKDIQVFAQQGFASQAFSRFIGAELTTVTNDSAELSLTLQDHHRQQHGFVHGGVISYLADNAITFAGGLALGNNALTAEFKINYLRPGAQCRQTDGDLPMRDLCHGW